jgi:signal transduction histidine kinase
MDAICAFFTSHMVEIFFLYGLAFFMTGVIVWLEVTRSPALPTAKVLPFLAAFGLIHGGHEWVEMFQIISPSPPTALSQSVRLVILVVSFVLLTEFGLCLLALENNRPVWRILRWVIAANFVAGMALVWTTWGGEQEVWPAADAWCRYSLAVPGAVLAAAGLYRRSRILTSERIEVSRDLLVGGLAFLLYGIPGQVFVGASPLPLSTILNSASFMQALHFPIQLWRSIMATVVAIATARALRLFELQRRHQVEELSHASAEAQRQLNEEIAERQALQKELLRQTVLAQEVEREHIARELHDEAGQALTALSWGLANLTGTLTKHPEKAQEQIARLQRLTDQVMTELRQITTRLKPAVLDELGLVAALITYADNCSDRFPFDVYVEVTGQRRRLPSKIEVALYRITQEAITNTTKHAQASHVTIQLYFGKREVTLSVSDDGIGMDVEAAQRAALNRKGWGLAGIRERIESVSGDLDINSTAGAGTQIGVRVPVPVAKKEEAYEPDPIASGG